jgi:WD40 repeat protein
MAVRANTSGPCIRVIEPALKGNFTVETIVFPPDMSVAMIGGGTGKIDHGPGAPAPGGAPPAGPGGGDAATLEGNAVQLLNLQRGEIIGSLAGHRDRVQMICLSADGATALTSGADEVVIVWDVAQGKPKQATPKQATRVLGLALSPDAKRGLLLTTAALLKFNPDTLKPMPPHQYFTAKLAGVTGAKETDVLRTVALSADGKALVGGLDGKLLMLDMPDKSKVSTPKPLIGHDEAVLCAVFDAAGRAATGGGGSLKAGAIQAGRDNTVRLWDLTDQKMLWKAEGHTDSVLCLAFSTDGGLLASGSADGTVRVWRVTDGKNVATFTGHTARVLGVGFSTDGKTVWSGSADKSLRQWRLP